MGAELDIKNKFLNEFSEQYKAQLDLLSQEQMQFFNRVIVDNYNTYRFR